MSKAVHIIILKTLSILVISFQKKEDKTSHKHILIYYIGHETSDGVKLLHITF